MKWCTWLIAVLLFNLMPELRSQDIICPSTACGNLNVNFNNAGEVVFCEGSTITLFNESANGFDYFIVEWGDGVIDTLPDYRDAQHTYDLPDSIVCQTPQQTVLVRFRGIALCAEGNSCQAGTYDFGIKPAPYADFTIEDQIYLASSLRPIDNSCHGEEYLWDFGDGITSTDVNPSHKYDSPGQYLVQLAVTNSCGSDVRNRMVTVVDDFPDIICPAVTCGNLNVNFNNSGEVVFCEGATVILLNESAAGFDYFTIDWGDGVIDTLYDYSDAQHVYDILDVCQTPQQAVTVQFRGIALCAEGNSCQEGSYGFGINPKPLADFEMPIEIDRLTPFSPVDLSCHADNYIWDFGDGTTSTDPEPSHQYTTAGQYQVKLTVFNSCGSDETTQWITVTQEPGQIVCPSVACGNLNVNFNNAGEVVFCEGSAITLFNESAPGFDYFILDWGDGTIDTLLNYSDAQHTYDIPDNLVCQTPQQSVIVQFRGVALCAEGNSCQTGSYQFGIKPEPFSAFGVEADVCISDPFIPTDNSCHAESYLWDFGDGSISTEPEPSHFYSSPGNYLVTQTVSNACGSDMSLQLVTVVGEPQAAFTQSANSGCAGTIVDFVDESNEFSTTTWSILPGGSANWSFTDTLMNLNSSQLSVLFRRPLTYSVSLTAKNVCGQDVATTNLVFAELPEVTINTPAPACGSISLTASDLGFQVSGTFSQIEWEFENGTPATATGMDFGTVTFTKNGSIRLRVVGACGDLVRQMNVTVTDPPDLNITSTAVYCSNDTPVQLTATPTGGSWSGAGVSSGGLFDPSVGAGTYLIKYQLDDPACPAEAQIEITVEAPPQITLSPPPPQCPPYTLNAGDLDLQFSNNFDQLIWTFTNGSYPQASGPVFPDITFNESGRITLQAANECATITKSVEVIVSEEIRVDAEEIVCPGDTYNWNGQLYSEPGAYQQAFVTPDGCDSLVTLYLLIGEVGPYYVNSSICPGEVINFGNSQITAPGQYTQFLTSAAGCDSTVVLTLEGVETPTFSPVLDEHTLQAGVREAEISLIANDDLPRGFWSIELLETPMHGTVTLSQDGILEYRLTNLTYQGMDEFSYQICTPVCQETCKEAVIRFHIFQDCLEYIRSNVTNAFTPDGDRINDLFDPFMMVQEAGCMVTPTNPGLTIVSSGGELLFEADPYTPWDGRFPNGQNAPQGLYYAILRFDLDEPKVVRYPMYLFRNK